MGSNKTKAFLLVILGLIVCLSTVSYLSNTTTNGTTIQTISGEQYTLNNQFTILPNKTILPIATTMPASRTTTWSNQSSAHTELSSGHWQLTVTVKMNSNAQPNTTHTITLQSGTEVSMASLGSIKFITPNSIEEGQTMAFVFDIGAELDSSMAFVAQIA